MLLKINKIITVFVKQSICLQAYAYLYVHLLRHVKQCKHVTNVIFKQLNFMLAQEVALSVRADTIFRIFRSRIFRRSSSISQESINRAPFQSFS